MKSIYGKEIWDAISEKYLCYRAQGYAIRNAFEKAASELRAAGKTVPAFSSFKARLYQTSGYADAEPLPIPQEQTIDTPPEPETEPEVPQIDEPGSEVGLGHQDRRVRILEDVVKLYRFRREEDIDAVCDDLLPDLLEEVIR